MARKPITAILYGSPVIGIPGLCGRYMLFTDRMRQLLYEEEFAHKFSPDPEKELEVYLKDHGVYRGCVFRWPRSTKWHGPLDLREDPPLPECVTCLTTLCSKRCKKTTLTEKDLNRGLRD